MTEVLTLSGKKKWLPFRMGEKPSQGKSLQSNRYRGLLSSMLLDLYSFLIVWFSIWGFFKINPLKSFPAVSNSASSENKMARSLYPWRLDLD